MLAGAGDVVSNGDDMMLFLQFNMGKTDPTNQMLLAQQEPVSQMRVQCPPDGKKPPPEVGYGWFHHPITVGGEPVTYLAKDGGVGGFTSWLGFQAWAGSGVASSTGAFVLTNSHGALNLGTQIIKILLGDPAAQQEDAETNYVPPVD
jgi:beta-lactamase class C